MECLVYTEKRENARDKRALQKMILSILHNQKQKGAVSVHLIGERTMKKLNWRFRRKRRVTDVLAFAMREGKIMPGKIEKELGDIFVCLPRIKKQARELSIPYGNELKRMIIHGLLHLLGYEHGSPVKERKMFSLQEKLAHRYQDYEY